jgi:glucokinase
MFLGIEIGGTKLQLGVGRGDGTLVALERHGVILADGAEGIRRQIASAAPALIAAHGVRGVGYGFGGPVDAASGRTIKSHQVAGWDDFPLAQWTQETLGVPVVLNNDCDAAALAEARYGAGAGKKAVFYVTVGTGVGGGFVVDSQLYRGTRGIAAEIGHLRPGLLADDAARTVEAAAAGPGIVEAVLETAHRPGDVLSADAHSEVDRLAVLAGGDLARITTRDVFVAARQGIGLAQVAVRTAIRTLGWAIAQAITLLAPNVVVVGGGVSLAGEADFFVPLREETARYVFGPLRDAYDIVPAALGEEVVVHGALAAARDAWDAT